MKRAEPLGMIEGQPWLVPYDDRWPEIFTHLKGQLGAAMGDQALSVHHVGSTSVPGLSAKPVLDVLVGVADLESSLVCVPLLAELGFEYGPEDDIAERHYFRGRRNGLRTHHLSLAEQTSTHFINSLVFRDALRASRELAREYEVLKRRLLRVLEEGHEVHEGKTDFVESVLRSNGGVLV